MKKMHSFRKSLLLKEISQHEKELIRLHSKMKLFSSNLQHKLGYLSMITVKRFLKECDKQQAAYTNQIHHKKLLMQGLRMQNLDKDPKVVINLSHRKLTPTELSSLNHGLKYSILPSHFDFLQTQASFEQLYQQSRAFLNFRSKIEFKRMLMNLYSKYKSGYFYSKDQSFSNLPPDQLAALKNLSTDKSLILRKPDKGNGVLVLNKSDYLSKMYQILKDQNKFRPTTLDNNLENLIKFQRFLPRLKKRGALKTEDYHRIRPTAALTPSLYGL